MKVFGHAGVLPELDALGGLLEASEEWQQDASGVRARMLVILGAVADRYKAQGISQASSVMWLCKMVTDALCSSACLVHPVGLPVCEQVELEAASSEILLHFEQSCTALTLQGMLLKRRAQGKCMRSAGGSNKPV